METCEEQPPVMTDMHTPTQSYLSHWLSKPVIDKLILRWLKYRSEGEWVAFWWTIFIRSYLNLAWGWSTASAGQSHPLPSLNLWNIDHAFFPCHWVWKDISTKCSCHLQNSGWEFHSHVFSPSHKQTLDILSSTIDPPDFMSIAFPWMFQSGWTAQGKDMSF